MDEQYAIDVISGRRRGVIPAALRIVCHAASWGYAAGITLRNAAYDHGWLRSHRVNVPVISVGNITTGGTGKTPMVAWFAQRLKQAGYRPGILSRGYRSLDTALNDEALVLERLCPGVMQVPMRDRIAGAAIAVERHDCDALVLDDAFQHRRLARSLDVVLIDALQPWGYGHLLPRGLLREPLSALKRADVVIITRANQADGATLADIRHTVARVRGIDEHIAVRFAPQRFINGQGQINPVRGFRSGESLVTAFCGIGNPTGFRRTLLQMGIKTEVCAFPDHHHYTADELDQLGREMQSRKATAILTTMKDLVKVPADHPLAAHIWAVDIAPEFMAGEEHLQRRLASFLPGQPIKYAA